MQTAEQMYTEYRETIPATLGDPTPHISWPTWEQLPKGVQQVWIVRAAKVSA